MEKGKIDVSRYVDVDELQLELEFVTPAFLGGADGESAELRAASIKGLIRYWWRVLYGSQCCDELLKHENEIFGSTENASNLRLFINLSDNAISPTVAPFPDAYGKGVNNILNYLAYGKRAMGRTTKDAWYFKSGEHFCLIIRYSKKYSEEIMNALSALITFGGIGAKNRNGYGSLFCINQKLPVIIPSFSGELKSFPVISNEARLFQTRTKDYPSWDAALSNLGDIYKSLKAEKLLKKIVVTGDNRNPKDAFMHVLENNGKYQGQILLLPTKSNIQEMKQIETILSKQMNSIPLKSIGGLK